MNIEQIVRAQLVEMGADGLFHPEGECTCELEDLMPCEGTANGGPCGECTAGKKGPVPEGYEGEGHEWWMYAMEEATLPPKNGEAAVLEEALEIAATAHLPYLNIIISTDSIGAQIEEWKDDALTVLTLKEKLSLLALELTPREAPDGE